MMRSPELLQTDPEPVTIATLLLLEPLKPKNTLLLATNPPLLTIRVLAPPVSPRIRSNALLQADPAPVTNTWLLFPPGLVPISAVPVLITWPPFLTII